VNPYYVAVLEDNPFIPTSNRQIVDRLLAEMFLDKVIEAYAQTILDEQINDALDRKDERRFLNYWSKRIEMNSYNSIHLFVKN